MKIIIGFSFGRRGEWPNLSTQAIAKLIAEDVRGKRADHVIIAQWEVAEALTLERVEADHTIWSRPGGGYLRTSDIAILAYDFIAEHQLGIDAEVFAAAHPDHVGRCIKSLRDAGIRDAKPLTAAFMVYDPESTEFWVRGRVRFLAWNLLATLTTTSLTADP